MGEEMEEVKKMEEIKFATEKQREYLRALVRERSQEIIQYLEAAGKDTTALNKMIRDSLLSMTCILQNLDKLSIDDASDLITKMKYFTSRDWAKHTDELIIWFKHGIKIIIDENRLYTNYKTIAKYSDLIKPYARWIPDYGRWEFHDLNALKRLREQVRKEQLA